MGHRLCCDGREAVDPNIPHIVFHERPPSIPELPAWHLLTVGLYTVGLYTVWLGLVNPAPTEIVGNPCR